MVFGQSRCCFLQSISIFESITIYRGTFENDYFHGKGELKYKNDDVYQGDFRLGNCRGQGTYLYKDGRKYTGGWKNSLKDGFGVYEWVNGEIYKGHWEKGVRHGFGHKIKGNLVKEVLFRYNKKIRETTVKKY